ncbi:MAG: type II toxin-antitoxin system HicA family toxin [Candidatus Riflebacteria bacterium]|nr:type II toxin-antitoxin system HicA family toxin [Candidatus Riflebacteria bacterium]
MKRKEFLQRLQQHGCSLLRHGANHDIFLNPANGRKQPVPRHADIDDQLARHILKHLGFRK